MNVIKRVFEKILSHSCEFYLHLQQSCSSALVYMKAMNSALKEAKKDGSIGVN